MLHGIDLAAGGARWYRSRWVRTALLDGAPAYGDRGPRLEANPANTHIVEHGGHLLALCEAGLPYQVTRDLDTVGPYDFGGRLQTAMTAHPKTDADSGDLFFFGYATQAPYVTFHHADAAGRLLSSQPVEVPGPTMMHDFAVTEHHVVWLDLPVTFSLDRWRSSGGAGMPYAWDDGYGARLGLMDRSGGPVRWFDIEPCFVFHVGNATEDPAGRIVLDAVRYSPAAFTTSWSGTAKGADAVTAAQQDAHSVLHRWVLDPASDRVTETALDDRAVEFPSLNDAHSSRASRYRYAASTASGGSLVKYDLDTGAVATFSPPAPTRVGEASFVPSVGARSEDDGWLLSILTPEDGSASTLVVLDATDLAAGPTAEVTLPRRVPAGFHGSWIGRP